MDLVCFLLEMAVSSQVTLAVGTIVSCNHAFRDAAWDQTAPQPASEDNQQCSRNPCQKSRLRFDRGINFCMARWTYRMRRTRSHRNDCRHDQVWSGSRLSWSERSSWINPSNSFEVAWRGSWRRSLFTHLWPACNLFPVLSLLDGS